MVYKILVLDVEGQGSLLVLQMVQITFVLLKFKVIIRTLRLVLILMWGLLSVQVNGIKYPHLLGLLQTLLPLE